MLHLPQNLPAAALLRAEGTAIKEYSVSEAMTYGKGTNALRILFLNLMPQKAVTELDIARTLGRATEDVILLPMKISGQTYKTTPMAHMEAFYHDFEDYEAAGGYDGLILTGAPVEHLKFEDVRYWPQLCRIMDWADTQVRSTLYICWGAQAGLYHHYGIPKYPLPAKCFGIYPQSVCLEDCLPMRGLSPAFPMPNSRHTEVRHADFIGKPLDIVAESPESGIGVAIDNSRRRVFIVGHLEYEPCTLLNEYRRDVAKGLPINVPKYYFENNDPAAPVRYTWGSAAVQFYANWLCMCRKQQQPS